MLCASYGPSCMEPVISFFWPTLDHSGIHRVHMLDLVPLERVLCDQVVYCVFGCLSRPRTCAQLACVCFPFLIAPRTALGRSELVHLGHPLLELDILTFLVAVPLLLYLYVSVCPLILRRGVAVPSSLAMGANGPWPPGAATVTLSGVDIPRTSKAGSMSRTGIG